MVSGAGSAAYVRGDDSTAVANGQQCVASGTEGAWLVLVECDTDLHIVVAETVQVGTEDDGVLI